MVKKIISLLLLSLLLACGYDYGKHWWLSEVLETSAMARVHLSANRLESVFVPFKSYVRLQDIQHVKGDFSVKTLTIQNDFWDIQKFYGTGNDLSTSTGMTAQTLTLKVIANPMFILRGQSAHIECRHCVLENLRISLNEENITAESCDTPWTYDAVDSTLKIALNPTKVRYNTLSVDLSGRGDLKNLGNSVAGDIYLNIKGLPEVIHALEQAGHLTSAQAQTFLFGSALMSNGQGDIPLTLTLKDNTLFLGPIPLYTFPTQ